MAYATQSDIENELKGITFGADTKVTVDAVVEMITQESAVIDQYLSLQYTTPVTETKALPVLKKICTDFVTYRVAKIMKIKDGVESPDSRLIQQANEAGAYRESMKLLKQISEGTLPLSGLSLSASKSQKIYISPQPRSESVFKKDEKQW